MPPISEIQAHISTTEYRIRKILRELLDHKQEILRELEDEDISVRREMELNSSLEMISNMIEKVRLEGLI